MLQERINELNSAILDFKNSKVLITGFLSEERLNDYYNNDSKCQFSTGIYSNRELYWGGIKDNALFILKNNDIEFKRYKFEVVTKNSIKYKDNEGRTKNKTYIIRKCNYSNLYNFIARDVIIIDNKKVNREENVIFENLGLLKTFFIETFGAELGCIAI